MIPTFRLLFQLSCCHFAQAVVRSCQRGQPSSKLRNCYQGRSEACASGATAQGATQEGAQILRRNDLITNYLILKYEISIINEINVIKLNNNLTNLA